MQDFEMKVKSLNVGETLDYLQSQGMDSGGCVCSALNALVTERRNNPSPTESALLAALKEMVEARKKPILEIVGHHPVDGHPLNASGVAVVKALAAIQLAGG